MSYQILHGNNLEVLPTLPDNSVDSIVTDPPYELGFMGKKWDSSGIAYSEELWTECLRVLKPGGFLLSFGGTRTFHRVAVAIEDSGFELRDSIAWIYGSGFPKSLDISKAIDKQAGAEREKIRVNASEVRNPKATGGGRDGTEGATRPWIEKALELGYHEKDSDTAATPEAQQWQGWGTALKPAQEPIIVARKPLGESTVAANVLKWGTGGINIDGSRIGYKSEADRASAMPGSTPASEISTGHISVLSGIRQPHDPKTGRWPANIILDEYTAELLDEQSGVLKSGAMDSITKGHDDETFNVYGKQQVRRVVAKGDTGGASRFFYVAKASRRDRNEGLDELPEVRTGAMTATADGSMLTGSGNERITARQNFHPTVKPTSLMEYLVTLVTPPNGTVLDPFTGSGSTGKAAILKGFDFIGIEMRFEYYLLIHPELLVLEG